MRLAITELTRMDVHVHRHSHLYLTTAWGGTPQPDFLNAAVLASTSLSPIDLLRVCKRIESQVGRRPEAERWGPRPLDLDIVLYGDQEVQLADPDLAIPHRLWSHRDFVMAPCADLHEQGCSWGGLRRIWERWQQLGGECRVNTGAELKRVFPWGAESKGGGLHVFGSRTEIMGILNATPDSFSDGGRFSDTAAAVAHAAQMVAAGADILDIGGQSTRPGASPVSTEEEIDRVLPIIEQLRGSPIFEQTLLSVDTFDSRVAAAAVDAGVDIVNDVSGGALDTDMFSVIAQTGIPFCLMHMRGTPQTMQAAPNLLYQDGDIMGGVMFELRQRLHTAMEAGVAAWQVILDPGLGFSKTHRDNLRLMKQLPRLQDPAAELGVLASAPLLVGPSRKGFLGTVTGHKQAVDRDIASAVAAALCVPSADIVRTHNVAATKDALAVADAVHRG